MQPQQSTVSRTPLQWTRAVSPPQSPRVPLAWPSSGATVRVTNPVLYFQNVPQAPQAQTLLQSQVALSLPGACASGMTVPPAPAGDPGWPPPSPPQTAPGITSEPIIPNPDLGETAELPTAISGVAHAPTAGACSSDLGSSTAQPLESSTPILRAVEDLHKSRKQLETPMQPPSMVPTGNGFLVYKNQDSSAAKGRRHWSDEGRASLVVQPAAPGPSMPTDGNEGNTGDDVNLSNSCLRLQQKLGSLRRDEGRSGAQADAPAFVTL